MRFSLSTDEGDVPVEEVCNTLLLIIPTTGQDGTNTCLRVGRPGDVTCSLPLLEDEILLGNGGVRLELLSPYPSLSPYSFLLLLG